MTKIEEIQNLLTSTGRNNKPVKLERIDSRCIVCTSHASNVYGYLHFSREGKKVLAHRMVYEAFIRMIPEGLFVLHKCDNPPCMNPEHLFIGTQTDNMRDMTQKGRARGPFCNTWTQGEKHGAAKLTTEKVLDIRRKYATGHYSKSELAREHSVSRRLIRSILNGKQWKHLLPAVEDRVAGPACL